MKKIVSLFGIITISILYTLGAWVVIHILAVFGMLLAIAYPLLWLLAPKRILCLFCRAGKEGTLCPLCKKQIVKQISVTPEHFRSALLNGIVILLFSAFSIGIVFIENRVLSFSSFGSPLHTASFTIPTKGQYKIGEIFPMKITIENIEQPINAVQADVAFDPEKVEVLEITTNESFATVFIQKEINNNDGWARLTGGLPNPGYMKTSGTFGTIFFRAIAPGSVTINFLESSLVLSNDGQGVNILQGFPSASYLILPETISEEEQKQQTNLITDSNVLGAKTGKNTQMKFYDERSKATTYTEKDIKKKKSQYIKIFFASLKNIDGFILGLWKSPFRI